MTRKCTRTMGHVVQFPLITAPRAPTKTCARGRVTLMIGGASRWNVSYLNCVLRAEPASAPRGTARYFSPPGCGKRCAKLKLLLLGESARSVVRERELQCLSGSSSVVCGAQHALSQSPGRDINMRARGNYICAAGDFYQVSSPTSHAYYLQVTS